MNAIVKIDLNSPQAIGFLQYARTLPFATVEYDVKQEKTFEQAAKECGAVSVEDFFTEVRRQQREYYDKLNA